MNNKPDITLYELEANLYKHEMKLMKEKEKEKNTLDKYFCIKIEKKNNMVY